MFTPPCPAVCQGGLPREQPVEAARHGPAYHEARQLTLRPGDHSRVGIGGRVRRANQAVEGRSPSRCDQDNPATGSTAPSSASTCRSDPRAGQDGAPRARNHARTATTPLGAISHSNTGAERPVPAHHNAATASGQGRRYTSVQQPLHSASAVSIKKCGGMFVRIHIRNIIVHQQPTPAAPPTGPLSSAPLVSGDPIRAWFPRPLPFRRRNRA